MAAAPPGPLARLRSVVLWSRLRLRQQTGRLQRQQRAWQTQHRAPKVMGLLVLAEVLEVVEPLAQALQPVTKNYPNLTAFPVV